MKINNKKIIVSTLALAVGAALAGSISGSVAWYQYSTRAAALVAGTSAGTSRNLQISKDNGTSWGQYVSFDAVNFRPSSIVAADLDSGETTITAAKDHPVYQYANLPTIGTGTGEIANKQTVDAVEYYAYQEYTFVFKCEDTKNNSKAQVAKDVYLSKLEIVNTGTNDITAAVRISIDGANGFLVSKAGGETATAGQLDINDNDANDTNYWDTQDAASRVTDGDAEYITYTSGAAYSTVYYAQMTEKTMSDTDLIERSAIPIDYYELIDYIWNKE